ncbi:MAG TPA: phosphoenolpyruvate--protein phosphotransferase [Geobacteraceae bacterium]
MIDEIPETLGLRTLEDISGIILHSHDLHETLDNIVTLVARRMGSDVCSIYLLEDDGETLTLQATKGLSRTSVGKVTMKTSEGLTGLVIEQRGVVNIENAPLHPRFKYFREAKEERFHSFLGIPLFERKAPIGVIVVQTREKRTFTPAEISTLSTIAYQISSIVLNAKLLDSISKKEEERAWFERELERMKAEGVIRDTRGERTRRRGKTPVMLAGTAGSPGFGWGKVYLLNQRGSREGSGLEQVLPRPEERKRFQIALEKAKIQTLYMEKRVADILSKEDAAIFHTHLMILEDRAFINRVLDAIDKDYGTTRAVRETVNYYVNAFNRMEDPYLRERSADMEDIGRRIIDCLDGHERGRGRLREKRVIVAADILPSDMATLDHEKILGIITEKGDVNSHAAIMARSLGIPAVLGIDGLIKQMALRDEVIIDGTSGHIYINPDERVKVEYERLQRDYSQKQRAWEELRALPAATSDGVKIALRANIGLVSDIRVALANGAEGVGLYRTEFPYMTRKSFPDRFEQCAIYRKILEGFEGLPVNIRTLDIGGDKGLPYFAYPKEDNPFMGWRSIRVSLEREDIFREQLAGVLMASPHGRASLMFPMVSGIEEVRKVKTILAEVKDELTRAGHPFDPCMRLGIMVEIPAAVQTAEILVREVDYFSIGTNDLIQYTLAADRNNPKVKKYYDPYHPAVLHSIQRVADVARRAGKGVSLCGEMAAEPMNAILLIGMGITDFGLSAPYIPVIKEAVRRVTLAEAQELAARALAMETSAEVSVLLLETGKNLGIYP